MIYKWCVKTIDVEFRFWHHQYYACLQLLIKWVVAFRMIIFSASTSSVFVISYIFVTYFNFSQTSIAYNNLVLGNDFKIFYLCCRFVIGRLKIIAGRILYSRKDSFRQFMPRHQTNQKKYLVNISSFYPCQLYFRKVHSCESML